MDRLRRLIKDLGSPGGLRRHPLLAGVLALIVALLIIGLAMRPI